MFIFAYKYDSELSSQTTKLSNHHQPTCSENKHFNQHASGNILQM